MIDNADTISILTSSLIFAAYRRSRHANQTLQQAMYLKPSGYKMRVKSIFFQTNPVLKRLSFTMLMPHAMEERDKKMYFPPEEERINIITHGLGIPLSILALIFLIIHASMHGEPLHLISFIVFGISLVLVYAASTFFHSTKSPRLRRRFNLFDHASIYVLIAGTYTPFALITLEGRIGWIIFGVVWGMAILGIIFKMFYIGKYRLLSTLSYVVMGWIIISVINPLINNLPHSGLLWLLAGAISYSIGAILYSQHKMKFNHAIFHIFVLVGSFCHFMSIYFYVL